MKQIEVLIRGFVLYTMLLCNV